MITAVVIGVLTMGALLGGIKSISRITVLCVPMMIALYLAQDSFGTAANVTGDMAVGRVVQGLASRVKGIEIPEDDQELQGAGAAAATDSEERDA